MTYVNGVKFELYGHDPKTEVATVEIDGIVHTLKVYYRHERTWDDHLGNTPSGYFVNAPLKNGKKKRIYLYR